MTTVTRLVSNPKVRDRLGLGLNDGKLVAYYPPEEIVKGLVRVVADLISGKENSRSLHSVGAREQYASKLPTKDLPKKSARLAAPVLLAPPDHRVSTRASGAAARAVATAARRREKPRETLVPRNCHLQIGPPRIKQLFRELCEASVEDARNLCAVGLRVFTELSVDHVIVKHSLMAEEKRRNSSLAKRLKVAAVHLEKNGMDPQLRVAIEQLADGTHSLLAAGTVTWNQYVHNKYVFPKPTELRDAWDELQPFFEHLWP